jgi:hypothetical protein
LEKNVLASLGGGIEEIDVGGLFGKGVWGFSDELGGLLVDKSEGVWCIRIEIKKSRNQD